MQRHLISVIIPAFNYARFIKEAIQSVVDQSYSNWEIIVIDDGSTDNTKDIVQTIVQREPRVKYYYQENKGLSAARNQGFKFSKGEYIQFLDADDLIHINKFSEQIEIMESNPTVDVCYTNFRWFRNRLENLTPRYDVNLMLSKNPFEDFLMRWDNELVIPIHAPLFRRAIWHNAPPFNEQLRAKEDWFMWCTLARNGKNFFFYDRDYAYYRLHGQNMCTDLMHMLSNFVRSTYYLAEIVPDNLKEQFYQANQLRLDKLISAMLSQNNAETLAEIYGSQAWKLSMWLRRIRSWVAPPGSIQAKIVQSILSLIKKVTQLRKKNSKFSVV